MATASPSNDTPTVRTLFTAVTDRLVTATQAVSFWATILLPMVVLTAILTGTITAAPIFIAALVPLTIVCAFYSRSYSPRI
jgi:hypothetical protein